MKKVSKLLILVLTIMMIVMPVINAAELTSVYFSGICNYNYAFQVLDIVNARRKENGLSELKMDTELLDAAMKRAAENCLYYGHTRPSGESCFTICDRIFAENVATGYRTPEEAMAGWMSSEGHRENILEKAYKSIGIGCFQASSRYWYWVQVFGLDETDEAQRPIENTYVDVTAKMSTSLIRSSINSLIDSNIEINVGDSVYAVRNAAIANAEPSWNDVVYVTSRSVKYESSNANVANVDLDGKITGVGGGTAIITATLGSSVIKYNVKVNSPLKGISLPDNIEIKGNQTAQLTVTYNPTDTTDDKTVTWTSKNPKIATIDNKGVVKGISGGTAVIEAKVGNYTATCNVTVKVKAESISFANQVISSYKNRTISAIPVIYNPVGANDDIELTWTCDNNSVATIDADGTIHTKSTNGKAKITATLKNGKSANFTLEVVDVIKGDINVDGKINSLDAAAALDLFKNNNAADGDLEVADVKEDGRINADDAASILDIFKNNN